jgi:hypothetical protein
MPNGMGCELQPEKVYWGPGYQEIDMGTKFAFKTAICLEYEQLLFESMKALNDFKIRRDELHDYGQNGHEAMDDLIRLREDYQQAYAKLIHHFDACEVCQSTSELKEKTQTQSGSVIPFRRTA